ncbi:MAG TPA: thiol:disulfide interchange protein DsbG [Rhodanobacteraceae bacterium]
MNKFFLMAASALVLALAGCAKAEAPQKNASAAPAVAASTVEKALAGNGLGIVGKLDAPAGYHGFVAMYHGRRLPVYVPPDGKHVLIGSLYTLQGQDLTGPAMRKVTDAGFTQKQWNALAASTWISTGKVASGRVVYAFMDTQCPYCHRLWQAAQPYLAAKNVELRVIPVAVISQASLPNAAAVLSAADPIKAWAEHETHPGQAVPVSGAPASNVYAKLGANNQLMTRLGFYGTPGVVYKDARGQIHVVRGLPPDAADVRAIFAD